MTLWKSRRGAWVSDDDEAGTADLLRRGLRQRAEDWWVIMRSSLRRQDGSGAVGLGGRVSELVRHPLGRVAWAAFWLQCAWLLLR